MGYSYDFLRKPARVTLGSHTQFVLFKFLFAAFSRYFFQQLAHFNQLIIHTLKFLFYCRRSTVLGASSSTGAAIRPISRLDIRLASTPMIPTSETIPRLTFKLSNLLRGGTAIYKEHALLTARVLQRQAASTIRPARRHTAQQGQILLIHGSLATERHR